MVAGADSSPIEFPVVVAVLTWRNEDATRRCLDSLTRLDDWPLETLVVDNASGTGEGERLAREFGVRSLTSPSNNGVPGGYNAALRWGMARGARYVLLMNNDITIPSSSLVRTLVAAMRPKVAASGPLVLDPDGSIFSAGGTINWTLGTTPHLRSARSLVGPYDVDWLDGPCVLVSLDAAAAVGGLAPEYFMYGEELDWCVRARRAGFRLVVDARVSVIHERSTRNPSMRVRELSLKNAIFFMRRNANARQNATALTWSLTYRPLAMAARCLRHPADLVRVPRAVANAIGWNVNDAIRRKSWRSDPSGPDLRGN